LFSCRWAHDHLEASNPSNVINSNELKENLETLTFFLTVRKQRGELLRFMNQVVEMARACPDLQAARVQELAADSVRDRPTLMVKFEGEVAREFAERAGLSRALLRCTALALAAERYRQACGQWPAALDDLVPNYVAGVPNDPFDGRPLKLAKHAQGIAIYSVGVDGVDNGGIIDISKGWRAPGTDLGFRLWDVKYRRQPLKETSAQAMPLPRESKRVAPRTLAIGEFPFFHAPNNCQGQEEAHLDPEQRQRLKMLHGLTVALIDSMNTNSRGGDMFRYAGFRDYADKYNRILLEVTKCGPPIQVLPLGPS
jgi:hypothetical protein